MNGWRLLPILLLAWIPLGCTPAPKVGDVKGRVTFEGKPVTEGTVSFFNADIGYGADATLNEDGTFVIKTLERGLIVGEYVVMITPGKYLDKSDPTTPPSLVEKEAPNIPEKYRRQGSTPLRATIATGMNELTFDMVP